MDRDELGLPDAVEVDDASALEGELVKVRLKGNIVVPRHNMGREQLPGDRRDGTGSLIGSMGSSTHVGSSVGAVADRWQSRVQGPDSRRSSARSGCIE
jgi:hypothetical protein